MISKAEVKRKLGHALNIHVCCLRQKWLYNSLLIWTITLVTNLTVRGSAQSVERWTLEGEVKGLVIPGSDLFDLHSGNSGVKIPPCLTSGQTLGLRGSCDHAEIAALPPEGDIKTVSFKIGRSFKYLLYYFRIIKKNALRVSMYLARKY